MARGKGVMFWLAAPVVVAAGAWTWLGMERGEPPPPYRFARVERGEIVATVSATGTVQPVTTVLVGSQLSGQVRELLADFNSQVREGQIIARLDDDQLRARMAAADAEVAQAEAGLANARAQAERAQAEHANAEANLVNAKAQTDRAQAQYIEADRDRRRKRELVGRGVSATAEAERAEANADSARAGVGAAKAQEEASRALIAAAIAAARVAATQIAAAEAGLAQRHAARQQVQVELDRSEIRSPIDGVVVRRDVDVGQTVAASLQAPTLFTIAQDLRQIEVHVAVDEADIGRVRVGQDALFTVAAHPATTFRGDVAMIRLGAQMVQNVVTYTVVINAENRELRLLPGMTTTVRVITDRRETALKVPNAALRWRPVGAQRGETTSVAATPAPAPAAGGGQGGWVGLDQLQATLITELKLDAEQQKQLAQLIEDGRRQFRDLRAANLPQDQLRARMRIARTQIEQRIESFLRADQKQAYEAWRAQRSAATTAPVQGRVHVLDADGRPRAISLRLGIGDGAFTEVIAGELQPNAELVIGGGPRAPAPAAGATASAGPRFGF
jgi:HlyD family secretion protein